MLDEKMSEQKKNIDTKKAWAKKNADENCMYAKLIDAKHRKRKNGYKKKSHGLKSV